MSISLIVTTCALAPHAATTLSSGRQPHDFRAYLLRCHLIPQALANPDISEVIVVGEFEEGDGYRYLSVPSVEQNSIHDSLRKRQAGCEAATGRWIIVQNDDHLLDPMFTRNFYKHAYADVVSPARWTRLRGRPERLNDGSQDRYINGHTAIYSREALQRCPWESLPRVFSYDIEHTRLLRQACFDVLWADDCITWDCELGATPWQ